MSSYLHTVSPGMFEVSGNFSLKYTGNAWYHYGPNQNINTGLGLVNNLGYVPPPLFLGLTGGRLFNKIIRPFLTYKSLTTP